MKIAIVIPARFDSKRLPGKPLRLIAGKSLLRRVTELAVASLETAAMSELRVKVPSLSFELILTSDDQRVLLHAEEIQALLTSKLRSNSILIRTQATSTDCRTGSDRVAEVLQQQNTRPDFVINLQGDAPHLPLSTIPALLRAFLESGISAEMARVFTPACPLTWEALDAFRQYKLQTPFSGTTVVFHPFTREAFWFSKQVIPAIRGEESSRRQETMSPVYRHLGIYGATRRALEQFSSLESGHFEQLEGLEQLRYLENGIPIQCVVLEPELEAFSGIDSEEDLVRAEAYFNRKDSSL